MNILAPEQFRHAAELGSTPAYFDPREFLPDETVTIDLGRCKFIRPPAALWALTYLLLARAQGRPAELIAPTEEWPLRWLKSLGFDAILETAGVTIRGFPAQARSNPHIALPLTTFGRESELDAIADKALERLQAARLGASNLYGDVSAMFGELALNALQHSESKVPPYGFIQYYEFREARRFAFGVTDGGVGILTTLARNPKVARHRLKNDRDAIVVALEERVSGTLDPHRGRGLKFIAEELSKPGRTLTLHSVRGQVRIEGGRSIPRKTLLFPGTVAYASIPT